MMLAGVHLGLLTGAAIDDLLAAASAAELTYDHVGSTLAPDPAEPRGIRTRHLDVGAGAADFAAAREALRTWTAQRGLGARIVPAGQPVVEGATVVVALGPRLAPVLAPNRIVAVHDEARRFAFAYGTLPGHPARGEESFAVEHHPDATVRATIRVQAVPATLAARAAAPLVHGVQALALRRYLAAVAAHTAGARRARSGAPRH